MIFATINFTSELGIGGGIVGFGLNKKQSINDKKERMHR